MKVKNCPLCHNHCAADSLSCGKGRKYFLSKSGNQAEEVRDPDKHGKESHAKKKHEKEQSGRHDREKQQKDDLFSLMRSCRHYLHHKSGNEKTELFSALNDQQKAELQETLKILLKSWEDE